MPKGLAGLPAAVDAALPPDLRVTPDMKERLFARIRTLEQLADPAPRPAVGAGRWRRRAVIGGWGTAAAAVLAVALALGNPPADRAPGMAPVAAQAARESAPAEAVVPQVPLPAPAPAPAVADQYGRTVKVTVAAADLDSAAARGGRSQFTATVANGISIPAQTLAGAEAQPGRKIIMNGSYSLRVADARGAVEQLRTLTAATGGYVAEATLNRDGSGTWRGRLVLRIPVAGFPGAVQQLGQIGEVESERQWSQDVTEQYMDLEQRVAILQEHEQRLRELAARAATFDDWNKVTGQINETRTQIENGLGRLKLLTNQVDYAILEVQVWQPSPAELPLPRETGALLGQVQQAFVYSTRHLGSLGRRAVVGLARLAPYAAAVLPVAGLLWLARWRRRSRNAD